MDSPWRQFAIFYVLLLGVSGCRINNAIAPEAHTRGGAGTSATPALVSPAPTSTGGTVSGSGNGQNAPGTSMPSGPGVKGGQLDKDNAAVVL